MTGLRELFEEATEEPPPSRLLADEVYAAGRRRLRHRRSALGAAALAVTAGVVAAVGVLAVPGAGPGPAPDDRGAVAGPPGTPGVLPLPGQIQWIGAADARHIYLALSTCSGGPCKTRMQLVGSDDGGRTWTERGTPMHLGDAAVLRSGVLLANLPVGQPSSSQPDAGEPEPVLRKLMTSRDGGRSWQAPQTGSTVPAVPSGSVAVCWPDPDPEPGGVSILGSQPCTVHAFDPVANRVSPLAVQPTQILVDRQAITESAGRLWAPGFDRSTGRPAVASSTDSGRTWSSHVFAAEPACSPSVCVLPSVAVGAGPVAYAMIASDRTRMVYQHTAAEGWQRRTGADQLPYGGSDPGSFVTPDGSHVLYQPSGDGTDPDGEYQFWAARGGGSAYQPVELNGLPRMFSPVLRAADGWLYALGDGDVSYGSTDGWHWVPLNRR